MENVKNITTTQTINEDGSLTLTMVIDAPTHKALGTNMSSIPDWTTNFLYVKSEAVMDRLYKPLLEEHMRNGTLTSDMTRDSLIMGIIDDQEPPPPFIFATTNNNMLS
tara:strand:- start:36 stop:359 length:324 start_codon:yes stop_codon:yes gene_type:complete